jgi:uncharacterized protein (TIGR02246 family)
MSTTTTDARVVIEAITRQFEAALQRKDATALSQMYTDDALLMPPGSQEVRGREEIRQAWEGILQLGIASARLQMADLMVAGDLLIETGRATVFGAGGAELDEGKYLVVWKQDGGTWKLHRDIWNSSRPPA